jgi:hypothetical protein
MLTNEGVPLCHQASPKNNFEPEYHLHKRAAVINAVYHAIGIRFRKLPVRPEDLPQTLTERAAQGPPTKDQHAYHNYD